MLSALRHRNFRLYIFGQFISLVGTWMQQVALSWLVYRLTQSTLWLGIIGFSSQIPSFFLSPFAGVFVDRLNRHRLLIWTQALAGIQAVILSFLTLTGRITLTEIVVLSLFLGIVTAVDMPARQSFYVQIIDDRKDLTNAIAINSSVMNATRLIGPAIGGVLIGLMGEGLCFLVNAISYLGVLVALGLMKVKTVPQSAHPIPLKASLKEGIQFAFGFSPIGTILILLSILSLIGAPYMTLFPAMADRVYHGGAHTLAILTVFTGAGAFAATVFLASRKSVLNFGKMMGICAFLFSIGLIVISIRSPLFLALPVYFGLGFTMMFQMASSNMVIQTLVEDDKRGRVMSLFSLALMGVSPFGGLLIGALAQKWGVAFTLVLSGMIYLCASIVFLRRLGRLSEWVEPVYKRLGILSEGESLKSKTRQFVF